VDDTVGKFVDFGTEIFKQAFIFFCIKSAMVIYLMTKIVNPIAYNPSLNETLKSLEKILENALDSVTEEQLLGFWTTCSERLFWGKYCSSSLRNFDDLLIILL
jgi:predicted choloylglycine hydrolase